MKRLGTLALLSVALWLASASNAHAGWGWHSHGCYGAAGCWGGYSTWTSYSTWGGYGSWAGYGGWGGHRGWWGSHRGWGCGVGCGCYRCTSCCVVDCCSCCLPSCNDCGWSQPEYGSTVTSDCQCDGEVAAPVEADALVPQEAEGALVPPPLDDVAPPAESEAPTPLDGEARHGERAALLAVDVDARATLFVNGYRTQSQGAQRRYLSSGLEPDRTYTYELRAELGDRALTKFVTLRAGEQARVDFEELLSSESNETTLTLLVPRDAQVTLAGANTGLTGARRVFSTTDLPSGQVWDDYVVQVTWEHEGRTLTKAQTLSLRGGESYELAIDFDHNSVATR